ncbi:histidine phosphatase family protein [Lentisphaera profundi]|uniref:Histidine phosphatase family protein n=1 Tax=Lentisphaera profundi TaxID=1658616 RepID=A0ABY7VSV5_9BACT|nr:histidine phosphatase family protein [Lentisphaera profundi]WDE97127.1 histidine phosphatase family protein [Lentisphaera profundi]
MRLFLFRHFAHQGKVGAFYGSTNLEIIPRAVSDLSINKDIDVLSSPLLRCQQSLERLGLVARDSLEQAQEVDFGEWEGLSYEEIEKTYPAKVLEWQNDDDFTFPKGESLKDFHARIIELAEIINKQKKDIFLMTHGGVIRYLICHYLGLDFNKSLAFKVDTGSLSTIDIFDEGLGILSSLNLKEEDSWRASLL